MNTFMQDKQAKYPLKNALKNLKNMRKNTL